MRGFRTWIGSIAAAFAALMLLAAPAQAQFSDSYRFLEAIRKKDGKDVLEYLNGPGGNTLVNTRDVTTGETALHIIVSQRDVNWITFLIGNGANPNIGDEKGVTPLVMAARIGFIEGVDALIAGGARIDDANDAGETPLMSAVHRRDIAMMRVLLKAGANPERTDNSGRSARDYALLQGAGSSTLAEIEARARPASADDDVGPVYGPTF